ncbi:MAG: DUF4330 domain-containing protein [Clostridiales bacterium]|nr:DUF4330 domain-containing protein [Clostridiales bacterium]
MKKINWVDYAIIAVVIAVLAGGAYYLWGREASTAAQTKKLWFQIETVKATQEIAEQFTVGTHVVFGEKKVDRGIITAVEVVPYEEEIENKLTGEWVMEPVAGYYQALVTVEFDGYETEKEFRGSQEQVNVGKSTIIEGKGCASEGYILGVGSV